MESKEVEVKERKEEIGSRSDFMKKLTMFRQTVSKKEEIPLTNKCKNCLLLQEELSKLKEENSSRVSDYIDDFKRSLRAVEERCASKDLRIDELLENVKIKETTISSLELEKSTLSTSNNHLDDEICQLKENLVKTEEELKLSKDEIESLMLKVKSLEFSVGRLDDEIAELMRSKSIG